MSKRCWLADGCPSRTAVCSSCEPDGDDCPIWRWFKNRLIVQCKDCKHYDKDMIYCDKFGIQSIDDNWYCADGEMEQS